jgi:hypothetical protein
MNKFKVGDRARAYYWDGYLDTMVLDVDHNFIITNIGRYHYKQCRKLKPRRSFLDRCLDDYELYKDTPGCHHCIPELVARLNVYRKKT